MNVDRPVNKGWFILPGMNRKARLPGSDTTSHLSRKLPFLDILPKSVRGHAVAMMGVRKSYYAHSEIIQEFTGTFLFLLFALGGTQVVNTAPADESKASLNADPAKILFISLCFGMSLAVNAWVFFRISGGLFNPAVTIGMCLIGAVPYVRGVLVIISQILGGIASAAVLSALLPGPLNVRTSLGGGTSVVQGLFIEMFLTAQLVFTIFMLAAEKHKSTFIAPIGIGLSLFIAELMGVYYTGGSVNPARTFGPDVVLHSFYHYHWIYWVGPILGAIVAAGFYFLMKALEYETVNPAADSDHTAFDPTQANSEPEPPYKVEDYATSRLGTGTVNNGPVNISPGRDTPRAYNSGPEMENGGPNGKRID